MGSSLSPLGKVTHPESETRNQKPETRKKKQKRGLAQGNIRALASPVALAPHELGALTQPRSPTRETNEMQSVLTSNFGFVIACGRNSISKTPSLDYPDRRRLWRHWTQLHSMSQDLSKLSSHSMRAPLDCSPQTPGADHWRTCPRGSVPAAVPSDCSCRWARPSEWPRNSHRLPEVKFPRLAPRSSVPSWSLETWWGPVRV